MLEDDVTWPEHICSCDSRRFTRGGLGWWSDIYLEECCLPSLRCWSILIRVLPSAFVSCALTVNVIGLLFLRQCFMMLSPSTETSVSGTSCQKVSQYLNWRMTWRDAKFMLLWVDFWRQCMLDTEFESKVCLYFCLFLTNLVGPRIKIQASSTFCLLNFLTYFHSQYRHLHAPGPRRHSVGGRSFVYSNCAGSASFKLKSSIILIRKKLMTEIPPCPDRRRVLSGVWRWICGQRFWHARYWTISYQERLWLVTNLDKSNPDFHHFYQRCVAKLAFRMEVRLPSILSFLRCPSLRSHFRNSILHPLPVERRYHFYWNTSLCPIARRDTA